MKICVIEIRNSLSNSVNSYYIKTYLHNININLISNVLTQESQNKLWKRLDGIGFNIKSEEIFSSLTAAHDLVKSRNLRPFLLLSDSAMEVSIYTRDVVRGDAGA